MIIARPEIAIMIAFGIMVPTGDNYSDLWLSYKFFTGNYEPAGKFYTRYKYITYVCYYHSDTYVDGQNKIFPLVFKQFFYEIIKISHQNSIM